jgi:hypothetical protein
LTRITEKEAVELASLGLAKPIKDMGFQLEFNSLAHLVQKLTSYEQRHPDIYQDKFKRQITLVDTEDVEDSGEEQEVAVAEWTQGENPVSCKWVKQQGLAKGFDFDESKVKQIFDLLLREKAINFLQHKSCKGDHIASGITYSPTPPTIAKSSVGKLNRLLSRVD